MKPEIMPLGAIQIKRTIVRDLALEKIQSIVNARAEYAARLPDLMAAEVSQTRKKLWARLFHRKLSDQALFDTWVRESSYFDCFAEEYFKVKSRAMFFAEDQMNSCKKLLALSNADGEGDSMWISDIAYAAIRQ
jgi:hypothetical protein